MSSEGRARRRQGAAGRAAARWVLLTAIVLATLGIASAEEIPAGQDYEQIERGRYLVVVGDCAACHTADPAQPLAGGRAIETPFGKLNSPNITPDAETGIGNWSDEQFDGALRRGVRPDGKRLYPAMPYPYYARMSRADVLAMRAYLQTVRPVRHSVHINTLPFPFSERIVMRLWDALYFSPGDEYRDDPRRSAEWNRGAYLVLGAGHCGACHTPKTELGGDKNRESLQGYTLQRWFAPDITNDSAAGLGSWNEEDIVRYLKTGHNRYSAASGPMGEEVEDSSSRWSDGDLRAAAVYLKSVAAAGNAGSALMPSDERMAAGAGIYSDLCSACHAPDGSGVAFMIPSLAGSPNVAQRDPSTAIRMVINGARSVATPEEPTDAMMPSYGWQLDDEQIAAVLTFIRNSWGHAAAPVSADEVRRERKDLRPGANP